jgi:hypothetical protein
MAQPTRLKLTRSQLSAFLKDPESIRQFERLFSVADTDISSVTVLIEEASEAAGSAMATAVQALDALESVRDDLELAALAPPPATVQQFSAANSGVVPASGGGTSNFLRADGAWAAPSGGSNSVKAWVNFDGTGAIVIRGSSNVASITDNGVGDYTVNFTSALTAGYAWSASSGRASALKGLTQEAPHQAAPTTTTFRMVVGYDIAGGDNDPEYVSAVFFGA